MTEAKRKTIILTGGSSGLGYEVLKLLLQHTTPYHIILPVRNQIAADNVFAKLNIPHRHSIEHATLDLASFKSVRSFADWFLERGLKLNMLILNAGAMACTRRLTIDNFEFTFQVNHLSNFLLVQMLLPRLRESGPGTRIVLVNSSMHFEGVGHGPGPDLDVSNVNGTNGYDHVVAYRNSKLAQMLFVHQLDRVLSRDAAADDPRDISVIALNPGFVPQTELAREAGLLKQYLLKFVFPLLPFTRTPEQGAKVIEYAATASELQGRSGIYINQDCEVVKSSAESFDEEKQKVWWNFSCDATGFVDQKL